MKTVEDIKLENDTFALRRDYKHALENLSLVKKDTAEIISLKDKITVEYEVKQEELRKVQNDISQEKLDWASHRHEELQKIENMKSDANNVLKRKSELNEQEQNLIKIEQRTTDVRNETRQLELKLQKDKIALEVRERALLSAHKKVKDGEVKLQKDKQDFKNKVVEVLKEIEKI